MYRIGNSIDIHKFGENIPLLLGGIKIDYELGLVAHSDGDVVLHSICEAIIGALGLGDIGQLFPDNDEKYLNIDSKILLREVIELMELKFYKVVNIDVSILCEKPHLNMYKDDMRKCIASICKVELNQINVKATRGEGLGFIGRNEGIASMCTVLIMEVNL